MTKLKCWKKFEEGSSNTRFQNQFKGNDNLLITQKQMDGKWDSFIYYLKKGGIKELKDSQSKSQALKFANKYMKEHDKC